jgi:hypothetical protein
MRLEEEGDIAISNPKSRAPNTSAYDLACAMSETFNRPRLHIFFPQGIPTILNKKARARPDGRS